jgi:hypothetical protein
VFVYVVFFSMNTRYYRWMEIVPALLVWGTFALMVLLSFLIQNLSRYLLYYLMYNWFLKTVYFFLHLNHSYKKMRKNMTIGVRCFEF